MKRKKIRILYAQAHEMLLYFQIPALISAGFEVIKPFSHILYRGAWKTPVKKIDDPNSEINQLLKNQCTLDDETLNAIKKIDVLGFSKLPFTIDKKYDFSDTAIADLTHEEKQLINDNIDVIFIGPFPTAAGQILKWFNGICIVGLYGIESGISNYELHSHSRHLWEDIFKQYKDKLVTNFFFDACVEKENQAIMPGKHSIFGSVSNNIKNKVCNIRWASDKSLPIVSVNISYLPSSPHALKDYDLFKEFFSDIKHIIIGKNDIYKNDNSIQLYIDDYEEMLKRYAKTRVFMASSRFNNHTRYTALENIAMGVPVLFLQTSVIGHQLIQAIGLNRAKKAGMCKDYREAKKRAIRCLKDIEYAKDLARNNQIILDTIFSEKKLINQAQDLYLTCENLLNNIADKQEFYLDQKNFKDQEEKKRTRILWGFCHESLRNEELPRFFKTGFEVIPIKIFGDLKYYQGMNYDDETTDDYPKWRKNCTLPRSIANKIREIKIYDKSYGTSCIAKQDIKILNQYIGIIYVAASIDVSLKLLEMGYNGIILLRYCGHYSVGMNSSKNCNPSWSAIVKLSLYYNVLYCPALHCLPRYENPLIGRKDKMAYIGYLTRKKSNFIKYLWKGKKSKPVLGTVISSATRELFHYYSNFIKHFGHLSYKIFGKNTKAEMQLKTLVDDGIVGQLKNASDLYDQMSYCRVYVELGMVAHHCHYTPIEAIAMEMPVIFWSGSGLATEAMVKFSATELFAMGMCATWDQMSVMAEKCLLDVDFAIDLAKKQRPLENIVTEDDIATDILKFKEQIPSVLKKIKNQNSNIAIKGLMLSTSLFLKRIRNIHISLVSIKILRYLLLSKSRIKNK